MKQQKNDFCVIRYLFLFQGYINFHFYIFLMFAFFFMQVYGSILSVVQDLCNYYFLGSVKNVNIH